MACCAIGVSGPPSCGRMTSTSGFWLMSVSTWETWLAESLVPSDRTRSTSRSSAALRALSVIAFSQPWSAPGALKPTLTGRPVTPSAWGALVPPGAPSPPPSETSLVQAVSVRAASATMTTSIRGSLMLLPSFLRWGSLLGAGAAGQRQTTWSVAALQGHGGEDEHALDDALDLGGHVEQFQQVEDQREGDDAEEGAGHRRLAAGEGSPADDHGGDRVQLDQVPHDRGGASQPARQQGRRDPHAQPGEHVDGEDDPVRADAGDPGGAAVAADRDRVPAEGGPVEQHPAGHGDNQEDQGRDGHAEHPAATHPLQDVQLTQGDGGLVAHPEREAAGDGEHGQGRDEGDDPAPGDGQAVDRPEEHGETGRGEYEDPGAVLEHQPAGDAGRGQHRPDRQVDPAGGDHKGHADGDDAGDAGLGEHIQQVVAGREDVGLDDRADDQQGDDHHRQHHLLDRDLAPAGQGVARGAVDCHFLTLALVVWWTGTADRSTSSSVLVAPSS